MIRPCGYLENIWPLATSLYRKERRDAVTLAGGRLVVRDGEWEDDQIKKGGALPHLRVAIQKANRILIQALPELGIGKVAIEQVLPGQASEWVKAEDRTVFAIVTTTPPVRLYASGACVHLPTGDIHSIDAGDWWSFVNDGPAPHMHLTLTLTERSGD